MGRGEYYKNKYGGGRSRGRGGSKGGSRGRGNNHNTSEELSDHNIQKTVRSSTSDDLTDMLLNMDNKPYNFYKDLYGHSFQYESVFDLKFEHIQGDPYAAPSRICVTLPLDRSRFPTWSWESPSRAVALADYVCRVAVQTISEVKADQKAKGNWHEGKGGELRMEPPSQNMLLRTSCQVLKDDIVLRFCVGLPARGRSICGKWAADLCTKTVKEIVYNSCCGAPRDLEAVKRWVELYEDQECLRGQLEDKGLVAFVPEGAVLPRTSGRLDTPMSGCDVVPFQSPASLQTTLQCPNKGTITGMGIKRGVTLIAGGGFHGKTTLLSALKLGVYSKIPADGREYLVSTPSATKIRAEDGRSIFGVDISNFINNLPQNKDTTKFYSCNASGSTSQAAAIMEYIELGGNCLLIDEDTAATNFMVRDEKIQMLLPADKEPIKPYLYRARELFDKLGVSSVVVVGGSGDYLDVADCVLLLDNFRVNDVTDRAKQIAAQRPALIPLLPPMLLPQPRILDHLCLAPFTGKTKVPNRTTISYMSRNEESPIVLDLSALEQLVEVGQTRFISEVLAKLASERSLCTFKEVLTRLDGDVELYGLGCVKDASNWLCRPRVFEIGAAINRFRELCLIDNSKQKV